MKAKRNAIFRIIKTQSRSPGGLRKNNQKKSLNFTYSAVENFIKDLYTINNIESPIKEEVKKDSKKKNNKESLLSAQGGTPYISHTSRKTMISSASKTKLEYWKNSSAQDLKAAVNQSEIEGSRRGIKNSCNENIKHSISKKMKSSLTSRNTFIHSKYYTAVHNFFHHVDKKKACSKKKDICCNNKNVPLRYYNFNIFILEEHKDQILVLL